MPGEVTTSFRDDVRACVKDLFDDVKSLKSKVATLEGRVTTLEGRVSTLEGRVSTLETKVDSCVRIGEEVSIRKQVPDEYTCIALDGSTIRADDCHTPKRSHHWFIDTTRTPGH